MSILSDAWSCKKCFYEDDRCDHSMPSVADKLAIKYVDSMPRYPASNMVNRYSMFLLFGNLMRNNPEPPEKTNL